MRLDIIATTYHSTIFKTHVFSFYSHLSIYIATHLHTVYLDWLQAAVLENNSRCASKWQLTELRHTLWGCDRASLEMHLKAVIERIWRYIGGRDPVNSEIHSEIMTERVWRYTWRPRWCKLGGRYRASLEIRCGGCDRATLDEYLQALDGRRAGCWESIHQ